jgi:hypothetical protein
VEEVMEELLRRLIKAVYGYERLLDRIRREEGEMGHCVLVERIARKFGRNQRERLFIMETLANYRGEE